MELASHLHLPLFEIKRRTSSSDFVLWQAYLEQKRKEETEHHDKLDWYLAQVAHEVFRANTQVDVHRRNSSKPDEFLLDFQLRIVDAKEEEEKKEKERKRMMMNAKLFFCCLTGVGTEALSYGKEDTVTSQKS